MFSQDGGAVGDTGAVIMPVLGKPGKEVGGGVLKERGGGG